jgi:hypothetical protein
MLEKDMSSHVVWLQNIPFCTDKDEDSDTKYVCGQNTGKAQRGQYA